MKKFVSLLLPVIVVLFSAGCGAVDADMAHSSNMVSAAGQSGEFSELPANGLVSTVSEPETAYGLEVLEVSVPAPSLAGNLVGEADTRTVSVLVPKGYYDSAEAYPVLYTLSGYGVSHKTVAEAFESLMLKNELDGMLVVCIDGKSELGCSYYVNSPVTGNWQDFVTADLVSYIDTNYRTVQSAAGRGLAGHSAGGFGALQVALDTQGVFGAVYAMSPAIFAENTIDRSFVNFEILDFFAAEYTALTPGEYIERLNQTPAAVKYVLAYASAFAYDTEENPPYIKLPAKDGEGTYLQDEIYQVYVNGLGGIKEKVSAGRENLLSLSGLRIDYGNLDELSFIIDGCEYLADELRNNDIPFVLDIYEGTHSSMLEERLETEVWPYFYERFY